MGLNVVVELDGGVERLLVARGARILAEAIDDEADGIGLLLGVERLTLTVKAPVDATVLFIDEMVENIVLGTCGGVEIFLLFQHAVGGGECPQNTSVEDGTLLCFGVHLVVTVDTAVVSAVLIVGDFIDPVPEDVVLKALFHFFLECFHSCYFLMG